MVYCLKSFSKAMEIIYSEHCVCLKIKRGGGLECNKQDAHVEQQVVDAPKMFI